MRQRQPDEDPPAEVAQRDRSPTASDDDDPDADREHDLDRRRQAGPEAPEAGGQAEDAIANRSRMRSMKTVPKVRLSETRRC